MATPERTIIDREDPYCTAQEFRRKKAAEGFNLFYAPDEGFFLIGTSQIINIGGQEMRADLYEFLSGCYLDDGNGISVEFKPKKRDVDLLFDALMAASFDRDGAGADIRRERRDASIRRLAGK